MRTRIVCGNEVLGEFDLAHGEYVIGSGENADFRLGNASVASHHARLRIGTSGVEVEDLGSGLGTLLGELAVAGVQPVPSGSMIQVGDLTLYVWDAGDEIELPQAEPAADGSERPSPSGPFPIASEATTPCADEAFSEGRYLVGEVVAQGAMGVIRRAHELTTGREVAMKQMHGRLESDDAGSVARFVQEAKITAHLEHPNVVPVHDVSGGAEGARFYTMKMVRGISLEKILELLAQGAEAAVKKHSLEALLTLFQKVCDALAFAHSKGVIHRDLKPANIMVGEYGEVLVMDWGVAKIIGEADGLPAGLEASPTSGKDSFATMAGTVMGTPYYMAPEQARGEVECIDERSDVYALGAILYELLTLKTAVEGGSAAEVLKKVCAGKLIPPLERAGTNLAPHLPGGRIPASLAAVAMKALSFSPERRYQHVAELQADVRAFQSGRATGAEDASAWRQFTLLVQRNKAISGAIAASLVLLGALSAIYAAGVIRERNRANVERDRIQEALVQVDVEKNKVQEALALVEPEKKRAEAERDRAEAKSKEAKAALAQINDEKNRAAEALTQGERDRQRAVTEGARAEEENKKNKADLAQLRATAPAFLEQAEALIENQNVPEALEKLNFAIAVDPGNPAYLLRRAHLRQATLQFKEAADDYRRVLAKRPDASASLNLNISEGLLKDNADPAKMQARNLQLLYQSLISQKRHGDSVILASRIGNAGASTEALAQVRFRVWEALPNWKIATERFGKKDGAYFLDLSGLQIADLTPLTGLPIQTLDISGTRVSDLTPLRGLPLRTLIASDTLVTDLNPLQGLKIASLNVDRTTLQGISRLDIAPLRGLPLTEFSMRGRFTKDLTPLQGSPLQSFKANLSSIDVRMLKGLPLSNVSIRGVFDPDLASLDNPKLVSLEFGPTAGITTLNALKTAPLSASFNVVDARNLVDIEALRGKPLTQVTLTGCLNIRNLSPLADCPTLTELRLPGPLRAETVWAASVATLRKLPKLDKIAFGAGPLQTRTEFWKTYEQPKPK